MLGSFFLLILCITAVNRTKLKKLFTWTIIYKTWFLDYFWLQEFIQQQTLKRMNKQKISLAQQIQSSSEEFLKEKLKMFNDMCSLFPWFNMQILIYVVDDIGAFTTLFAYYFTGFTYSRIIFELFISQEYIQNLERNWKISICIRVHSFAKSILLNFMGVSTK